MRATSPVSSIAPGHGLQDDTSSGRCLWASQSSLRLALAAPQLAASSMLGHQGSGLGKTGPHSGQYFISWVISPPPHQVCFSDHSEQQRAGLAVRCVSSCRREKEVSSEPP